MVALVFAISFACDGGGAWKQTPKSFTSSTVKSTMCPFHASNDKCAGLLSCQEMHVVHGMAILVVHIIVFSLSADSDQNQDE